MATEQVHKLAAVQEKDIAILKLKREVQDIPARKAETENRNSIKKDALAKAREELKEQQSHVKQVEVEVASEQQRMLKLREQQFQLKSNKEFKAMEEEIKVVEARISALEDKQLSLMEAADGINVKINAAKAELDTAVGRTSMETSELDRRKVEIEAEIGKLEAERGVLAAEVDPKWLARYDRMFQSRQDRVLVQVEHGTCGGCHMTLAPHLVHDARRGNIMTSCQFCGRQIYYAE